MRPLPRRLVLLAVPVFLALLGMAAPASATGPTLAQLIGQRLVVTMYGTTPHAGLLERIRNGEIGGIALLGSNITSASQLKALTSSLQHAAVEGGQPPLIIAVDQEGGEVKRVTWAPPTKTVPQMGAGGSAKVAYTQGARTGKALRELGINVDLAPVADVPVSTSSFMYQQGRVFGFNADETATLADAFASGLASAGELATMKHFPGIGLAIRNTDRYVDTITASRDALRPGLKPYRLAISHHVPLIMLSNATYTAWDPNHAAGWSPYIVNSLLRQHLGYAGVTITDSLTGTAHARGVKVKVLAIPAVQAGTDLILVASSEHASQHVYQAMMDAAASGAFTHAMLEASWERVMALKAGLSYPALITSMAAGPPLE